LLAKATRAPDLWNQQAYLARVVEFTHRGAIDQGSVPLAHFVDASGPDAVAVTIETDAEGDIHPTLYVRRGDQVTEHLLPSNLMRDYETAEHRSLLSSLLDRWT
jgi:hypothetical protein